ncbi:hypothetical protein [Ascidiimonas aurantiaca]|uniref:hypothetical protein n=1 Tax=Ascidiimonas aurantiaca TaxID=1685432 RepID=UPI0030EEB1FB
MNAKEDLFFHEDDYLQVEIIPIDNLFDQSKNLSNLKYDFEEHGFTNISSRGAKKNPTSSKKIYSSHLTEILERSAITGFNKVYTGYGSNSILKNGIKAYGYKDYAILFDSLNGIVQNIWLVFSPKLEMPLSSYSNLSNTLFEIGSKYNMILIDWNEEIIVDLGSHKKTLDYLNSL